MHKTITFITGNKYKATAMKDALKVFPISLQIVDQPTPEIQASSSAEVASFSARWAADKLQRPIIKADSGMFVEALNGLPGAYTSQFQKQLGPEKFLKLMDGETNRRAYIRYSLAYCEPGGEPKVFESGSNGTIASQVMGDRGMLIDYVFIPDGETQTLGMLSEALHESVWGDSEAQFGRWFTLDA